jgi:DNA-binding transcriptional LysR family regulator
MYTVLGDYEPEPVDVHAVWPKVSHLRPKVRYVVDDLVKCLRGGNNRFNKPYPVTVYEVVVT